MEDLLTKAVSLKVARSLEKAVYDKLLYYGYTPDRKAFLNNYPGFEAKKTEIKNTKGFCVDLFGHGASMDRKTRFVPRMVITGLGFLPGSVGNDKTAYYIKNAKNGYDKMVAGVRSSNYRFEIQLVSNKTFQDTILETIRGLALPDLTYIPIYDNPQDYILLQYGQHRQIPDFEHGLIQRTYTYEVLDVFETIPTTVSTTIAKIKSITVADSEDNSRLVHVGKELDKWFDETFDETFN